jgi:hypothetical protein
MTKFTTFRQIDLRLRIPEGRIEKVPHYQRFVEAVDSGKDTKIALMMLLSALTTGSELVPQVLDSRIVHEDE